MVGIYSYMAIAQCLPSRKNRDKCAQMKLVVVAVLSRDIYRHSTRR